jgi:hypothetical protein
MTVIFKSKNNEIIIRKLGKETYKLTYPYTGKSKRFWVNFNWSILGETKKIKDVHNEERSREFRATSVQTLSQFLSRVKRLSYQQGLNLFRMVGQQLHALEIFGHTILSLDMDNIIVINDKKFLLIDDSHITNIKNSMVEIKKLEYLKKIQKCKFVAPEVTKITSFPKKILPFSGFYNLSMLTIYCLFKTYYAEGEEDILNPIFHTKLYWALKRCLDVNPKNRYFLVI